MVLRCRNRDIVGGWVPDSFQALAVLTLGLIPGAIFFYMLEWHVGAWGIKAVDRLLRFVVASVIFSLLFLPMAYVLWRNYVLSGDLAEGGPFPLRLYGALLAYLAVPAVVGFTLGLLRARGRVAWLLGRQFVVPEPSTMPSGQVSATI